MTPETKAQRALFEQFIETAVKPEKTIMAVVAIGSLATGWAGPNSDADAIAFLSPLSHTVLPAEAIWNPTDNNYYSLFTEDETVLANGLHLDISRLDWKQWADPEFVWPEPRRAELSQGWVAYDPTGIVTRTIQQRTAYDYDLRLARLDESLVWLDHHLHQQSAEEMWGRLPTAVAFDKLQSAYNYLVQALFAYNHQWRVWRNQEMKYLLRLAWLPDNFAERVLIAMHPPSLDQSGFVAQADRLRTLFAELLEELIRQGDYTHVPIDQAYLRYYDEPGHTWNMDEWLKFNFVHRHSQ